MFAEDPGGVAHLAYHKEAGRVSGVVEEHPGGAVHPDHDHGTVQVVGVVAEDQWDVRPGSAYTTTGGPVLEPEHSGTRSGTQP